MRIEQDRLAGREVVDTAADGLDHSDPIGAGGKRRWRQGIAQSAFEHLPEIGQHRCGVHAYSHAARRGRLVGKLGKQARKIGIDTPGAHVLSLLICCRCRS
jgi:hypothetical protein